MRGRLRVAHLEVAQILHRDGRIRAAHGARQHRTHGHGAYRRRVCAASARGKARFIHPSAVAFRPGVADSMKVLRIEVRARRIGRSGRVYDGQVSVVPDRLEWSERRVQAEEAIQVDGGVFPRGRRPCEDAARRSWAAFRNSVSRCAAPQCSSRRLRRAGRSPPGFLARRGSVGGVQRALQPQRGCAGAHHGERRVANE
jgi:hypothetical protein